MRLFTIILMLGIISNIAILAEEENDDVSKLADEALETIEDSLDEQLAALRRDIISNNDAVQAAQEAAEDAIAAFLEAVQSHPELSKLNEEREALNDDLRGRDWDKRRAAFSKIGDITKRQRELTEGDENLKQLISARQEALASYTTVLNKTLAANPDYSALQMRLKNIEQMRDAQREQEMAERMNRWGNRGGGQQPGRGRGRGGEDNADAAKEREKQEQEKKSQDLKEF